MPLNTFQIHGTVDERVGILIWNGHADPHVEPVMKAWRDDQRVAFERVYEFMHLDDVVNYILESRLVTAFREALVEVRATGA